MRILAFFVLAIGIAVAGSAAFYAQKMFDAQLNLTRAEPSTVKLLVANRTLEPGTVLGSEDLQLADWPSWAVPPGAFSSTDAVFGDDGSDTRYVMNTIQRGEPILDGKLSEPNQSGRIPYGMDPNEGAVSIPINAVSGVGGFISPGDHVDILLTHEANGSTVSIVLLQKIRVLAIDQINNTEAASPRVGRTATVAVTTRQAQTLALARQKGSLSLILRNKDAPEAESSPLDIRELDGPLTPDGKPQKTVKLRKGGVVETVPVD